jgi:hypothetical protein
MIGALKSLTIIVSGPTCHFTARSDHFIKLGFPTFGGYIFTISTSSL